MKKLETIPAISIVIPTYNSEQYIEQTLESILNQTFQDFELILIDDCSTDRTIEIIEKFAPSFENLQLIRRRENSGSGSYIRNEFIKYARGEYILHMDHDDLLLLDALENFYKPVEKYQPDFVCTEKYFIEDEFKNNKIELITDVKNLVNVATYDEIDFAEKIRRFTNDELIRFHWNKIVRRDFLIRNEIRFPNMPISQDFVYTFQIFMLAKNYVRIPDVANFYRVRKSNLSQFGAERSGNKMFQRWTQDLINGSDFLEKFMSRIDFFQDNPEQKYFLIDWFIKSYMKNFMTNAYKQIPTYFFEPILREEFAKNPQKNITLLVHLFGIVNDFLKDKP